MLTVVLIVACIHASHSRCSIDPNFTPLHTISTVADGKHGVHSFVIEDMEKYSCVCSPAEGGRSEYGNITGWLSLQDCGALVYISQLVFSPKSIQSSHPNTPFKYVEVGSFLGLSTVVVASTFRAMNASLHAFAHDLYQFSTAEEVGLEDSNLVVELDQKSHIQQMYDNILHNNMIGTIFPIAGLAIVFPSYAEIVLA
jgi:hypothetical protein